MLLRRRCDATMPPLLYVPDRQQQTVNSDHQNNSTFVYLVGLALRKLNMTGWDGTRRDRTNRVGQDGRDRTGQDGTGRDGTGREETGQDGTGRDGTGQDGKAV